MTECPYKPDCIMQNETTICHTKQYEWCGLYIRKQEALEDVYPSDINDSHLMAILMQVED